MTGSKDQSENQGQKSIRDLNSLIKHSVSLNSEAFYVQDDAIAWWIDSGATTHVCKDRFWFKTLVPVEDGFVLYMGDDHFAPVEGKGNVVLEFSSGKTITLFNVLYVPKLRKNLISGPVLNKLGYKQVCESDKYVLSKSGVFVGFGYYNNGMFMMNLNGVPNDSGSVFISSSNVINSSLWHARLGHAYTESNHDEQLQPESGIGHENRGGRRSGVREEPSVVINNSCNDDNNGNKNNIVFGDSYSNIGRNDKEGPVAESTTGDPRYKQRKSENSLIIVWLVSSMETGIGLALATRNLDEGRRSDKVPWCDHCKRE
ncbi:hypothetical protein KIW84_031292 [Lathyrus oleraceus]|uniref:Retrovirus-related Pol polyprotein from transposon TNT 1-94-like beta-barrel domain-containing protein n=1 Tax=Pisum sativum TaxID=3888 RepID=A0A9D5B0F1_PEA|nr:hypothetical protein KIW84_031292 [Pisum sativum]